MKYQKKKKVQLSVYRFSDISCLSSLKANCFFASYHIDSFSSRDEDANQTLTYSLKNDDSGRFKVDSLGNLYKANDTDYETQTKHTITAVVTDSGNPSLKVIFLICRTQVIMVHKSPIFGI